MSKQKINYEDFEKYLHDKYNGECHFYPNCKAYLDVDGMDYIVNQEGYIIFSTPSSNMSKRVTDINEPVTDMNEPVTDTERTEDYDILPW